MSRNVEILSYEISLIARFVTSNQVNNDRWIIAVQTLTQLAIADVIYLWVIKVLPVINTFIKLY